MGVSGRRGGAWGGACWGTARPTCPSVILIQPSLAEDGRRQGRGSPAQHPVSSQTEAPLLTQKPSELRSYSCAPSGPCGDAENCAQCPLGSRPSVVVGQVQDGQRPGGALLWSLAPPPGVSLRLCPPGGSRRPGLEQERREASLGHQKNCPFILPKLDQRPFRQSRYWRDPGRQL